MKKTSAEIGIKVKKKDIEKIMIMCDKISSAIKEYLDSEEEDEHVEKEEMNFYRNRFNKRD